MRGLGSLWRDGCGEWIQKVQSRSSLCTDLTLQLFRAPAALNPAYPTWSHGGPRSEVPGSGNCDAFRALRSPRSHTSPKAARERHLLTALQPGPGVGTLRRSRKGSLFQTPVGCGGENDRYREGRGQWPGDGRIREDGTWGPQAPVGNNL